jgi:hypothetical protein
MGRHSTEHPPGSLGAHSIVGATQKVTGFEPATEMEATALPAGTCDNEPSRCVALALQTSGTSCHQFSRVAPDLHTVIAAWQTLPTNVRGAILNLMDMSQAREVLDESVIPA